MASLCTSMILTQSKATIRQVLCCSAPPDELYVLNTLFFHSVRFFSLNLPNSVRISVTATSCSKIFKILVLGQVSVAYVTGAQQNVYSGI